MSIKPVLLATPKVEADKAIVKDLREYLADAEAGEIESICIVAWRHDGTFFVSGLADDATKKIGALNRMIYDLLSD